MQKILVIGSSGAGKSTLARTLCARLGLPVIHLDRHYWHPGWQPTPEDQWREVVRELVRGDRWIIDGNYGGTFDLRFPEADTIIDLDYSTMLCLGRVFKRRLLYPLKGRPDMNDGCPEQLFAFDFYHYILRFRRKHRPRIDEACRTYAAGKTLLRFRTPVEAARWLDSVG